jgi:hypothetical protein
MHRQRVHLQRIVRGTALACWILLGSTQLIGCRAPAAARTAEQRVGDGAATMRAIVTSSVADADRRGRMLAIIDEAQADLEGAARELAHLRVEQETLDARHEAAPEEFRDLGDRIQRLRGVHRAKAIELRQKLAALATDAEWKSITARDLGLFSE